MLLSRRQVLAAGVAGVALKPENPLVGGTVLRRAAIQSPNFVTGVSGWSVKVDGSAEFNNVTVRGTVIASHFIGNGQGQEIMIYSGPPAAGNLVASITSAAGTDSHGNAFKAGITDYIGGGGAGFVELISGALDIGSLNAGTLIINDALVQGTDALFATVAPTLQISPPGTGHGRVFVNLLGGSQDGSSQSRSCLIDTAADTISVTPALLEVNGDTAFKTLSALATQSHNNFTAETVIGTYTIPANPPAGSSFTFWGAGVAGDVLTPTLQLRIRVGGLAGASIGNTGVMTCRTAAGMAFSWNGRLAFTATGASSSIDADTQINEQIVATTGGGHPLASQGSSGPSTLVPITVVITAAWGTASVSNTIQTSSGSLERIHY